jgi:hypothetical protein
MDDKDEPVTAAMIIDVLRRSPDERVRKAIEEGRFEVAPGDQVAELQPWINKILDAWDATGAFVSDLSAMADLADPETWKEMYREAVDHLGIDFERGELIISVARRLRDAQEGLTN